MGFESDLGKDYRRLLRICPWGYMVGSSLKLIEVISTGIGCATFRESERTQSGVLVLLDRFEHRWLHRFELVVARILVGIVEVMFPFSCDKHRFQLDTDPRQSAPKGLVRCHGVAHSN